MYSAVIFDLDGTLIDSTNGIISAVKYVIEKFQLKTLPDEAFGQFIGTSPIQDAFQQFCNVDDDIAQQCTEAFRKKYLQCDIYNAQIYKGIFELLEKLKSENHKLAIATYKRQDCALALIKHLELDGFFDVVYGADNDNKLNKADIIQKCRIEVDAEINECVMIGDSKHDALAAQSLAMDFIAVTYGFGFKNEKEAKEYQPVFTGAKVCDLTDYLCGRAVV